MGIIFKNRQYRFSGNCTSIHYLCILADSLVGWELGIAPGFNAEQQIIVVRLMRMNIDCHAYFFSDGLVMAGLQANQHFFLPALAPILYNTGQIFGALILAPETGYQIGGFQLPAMGLGVDGLVYGVIIGAALHLLIQVPGLFKFSFRWIPSLGLRDAAVKKVLVLLGPRVLTMLLIQLIFIVRDNLASRLESGAVTALAYGWMIQQVPETLIGTAIGTALLPTLSEYISVGKTAEFRKNIQTAVNLLIGFTVPIAFVLSIGLLPFFTSIFGFDEQGSLLLMAVTRGYLFGLTGHCLLEVAARAFYAQQNARLPLFAAVVNILIYVSLGSLLFKPLGAAGISLTDSLAFSAQAVLLLFLLTQQNAAWMHKARLFLTLSPAKKAALAASQTHPATFSVNFQTGFVILRSVMGGVLGAAGTYGSMLLFGKIGLHPILLGTLATVIGLLIAVPFISREIKSLLRL